MRAQLPGEVVTRKEAVDEEEGMLGKSVAQVEDHRGLMITVAITLRMRTYSRASRINVLLMNLRRRSKGIIRLNWDKLA